MKKTISFLKTMIPVYLIALGNQIGLNRDFLTERRPVYKKFPIVKNMENMIYVLNAKKPIFYLLIKRDVGVIVLMVV